MQHLRHGLQNLQHHAAGNRAPHGASTRFHCHHAAIAADGTAGARLRFQSETTESDMLSWSLMFLVLALIAGILGFTGIAGAAAEIAKILFFVFLVLLLISAVARATRGRDPM
jgi:uncharacterized membrane protein YtjA (UPF0391 family)